MDHGEQRRLAESFRMLHRGPAPLLLPNAWDAMSARLFEEAGFGALATTSAGMAWALGWPDGEAAPWPEIVAGTARIVGAVKIPVTADIEEGWADTLDALASHIAEIVATGAVGVNLEDGCIRGPAPIRPLAEAAARIRIARETANRLGIPIFINARTDLYLRNSGEATTRFDETVARGRAYVAAGADCVYPIGLADAETLARLVKAIGAPINVMGRPGAPNLAELQRIGVARVSTASLPSLLAMERIREIAGALRAATGFDGLASAIKHPDAQRLFARDR